MIIRDIGWEFDTDRLLAAAENEDRDWYERDMLNAFSRYCYRTYKQIRDSVNPRKCKNMKASKVKGLLSDEKNLNYTINLLNKEEKEIFFVIDFAEKYLKYIS